MVPVAERDAAEVSADWASAELAWRACHAGDDVEKRAALLEDEGEGVCCKVDEEEEALADEATDDRSKLCVLTVADLEDEATQPRNAAMLRKMTRRR